MSGGTSPNERLAQEIAACWSSKGLTAARLEVAAVPLGDGTQVLCVNFLPSVEIEADGQRMGEMFRQLIVFLAGSGLSKDYGGIQSAISVRLSGTRAETLAVHFKYWVNVEKLRDLEKTPRQNLAAMSLESVISGVFELPLTAVAQQPDNKRRDALPLPR
jgi:hypothetical protein